VHRRSTIGRWIPERWIGKDRRAQEDISRGVVVDECAAELAALLTAGLSTRVVLRSRADGTALLLLDGDGQPLRNYGGDRRATKGGREPRADWPIPVAIIFRDPTLWYARDLPVTIHLEAVPGTPVGHVGELGATVSDAAVHVMRHYGPAIDPTVEPGQAGTVSMEVPALRASDG
jgi:hypothetical protein